MLRDTPIKEIMVTKVVTVNLDELFSHVEEKMRANHIRHLPVLDKDKKLVGIITERDLHKAAAPHKTEDGYVYDKSELDSFVLKQFMTPNPIALKPESPISEAVDIMATRKYGCIPIVNPNGTLVGIVTQIDVLKFVHRWFAGKSKS